MTDQPNVEDEARVLRLERQLQRAHEAIGVLRTTRDNLVNALSNLSSESLSSFVGEELARVNQAMQFAQVQPPPTADEEFACFTCGRKWVGRENWHRLCWICFRPGCHECQPDGHCDACVTKDRPQQPTAEPEQTGATA